MLTDHKPLTAIFHPEKGIPQFSANRLRRWAVILSNYQYKIEFVKSKQNYVDVLSRLPIEESDTWENVDVDFITYFGQSSEFAIYFEQVQTAARNDKLLSKVMQFVKTQWPAKITDEFKPYFKLKDELSLECNNTTVVKTNHA